MARHPGMMLCPGDAALLDHAATLLDRCRVARLTLVTAESCTGGLVAALLTAIAGSSDVVVGGFVTYSNALKSATLGVAAATIEAHGAVSGAVAQAMAAGALAQTNADLAVAVTGVAGPGGGSDDKPVGLVWLAGRRRGGGEVCIRHVFDGDRQQVRAAAAGMALTVLGGLLG